MSIGYNIGATIFILFLNSKPKQLALFVGGLCTKKIISRAQLPIVCPKIPLDDFLAYMAHDKKVLNGQLRLVLLQQLGKAIITRDFDIELMQQAILAHQA